MSTDRCIACPCPVECRPAPIFCLWASCGDPVQRRHVYDRMTRRPPEPPTEEQRLAVAEAAELTRRMTACPHRSTEGCGCGGGRCALRGGAIVSHLDCFACLRSAD